jgi:hypothetical protein
MEKHKPATPKRFGMKTKIFLGIVALLLIFRIFLPSIVLHYANKRLAEMPGYYGHIEDVDIHLYRGAYTVKEIYLNKMDSVDKKQTPFFTSKVIDLSIEWASLWHGRIVAKVGFDSTVIRFTKDKVDPKKINEDSSSFRGVINGFMPLKINRLEVTRGKIQYVDPTTKPAVDVAMINTHVLATNLTNLADSSQLLPASININSDVYGGTFTLNLKLNPLLKDPTFESKAELKNANLPTLNPFLLAYAGVDVNRGSLSLYSEVAAKNGDFKGYVKPIIKDLKVLGSQDSNKSFLHKIYEGIVGVTAFVLTNHPKDQLATKIPIEGTFKKMNVDTWSAIFTVLRNAFIQALFPALDHDVSIQAVGKPTPPKTFWQKLFGGGDTQKATQEKKSPVKKSVK